MIMVMSNSQVIFDPAQCCTVKYYLMEIFRP